MNRLPLCMGGWCNNCWKSHLEHLERMKQIREEYESLSEQQRIADRRGNIFLFIVFGGLIGSIFVIDLLKCLYR
jgi:hypothetical protein